MVRPKREPPAEMGDLPIAVAAAQFEDDAMPLYEHVFIARQDISTQQVETLTESLQGIITEGGGKIEKTEYWGLRNLQYKIKKNRKGHYSLFHIDAPHGALAEMERQMRLNEDVLRFMTLKVEALDPTPSAILTKRDDRRGGRGGRDRGPPRDRGDRPRDRDRDRDRGDRDRGDRGDSRNAS